MKISYEYEEGCEGCSVSRNGTYCSYLNHCVGYVCPCLECVIKVVCTDACKEFDKNFWDILPEEERWNENKTL